MHTEHDGKRRGSVNEAEALKPSLPLQPCDSWSGGCGQAGTQTLSHGECIECRTPRPLSQPYPPLAKPNSQMGLASQGQTSQTIAMDPMSPLTSLAATRLPRLGVVFFWER